MDSKHKLFLDNVRLPGEVKTYTGNPDYDGAWMIVRNYQQFTSAISRHGLPEIVSLDHDLADISYNTQLFRESFTYYEETGYDCAKFLINYCIEKKLTLPKCLVHSLNPVGKENIINLLLGYKIFKDKEDAAIIADDDCCICG